MFNLDDIETLRGMCFRKKQLSYGSAQSLAKKYKQRPYACPVCQRWHLTKQTESDFLENINIPDLIETSNKAGEDLNIFFHNKIRWNKIPLDILLKLARLLNIFVPKGIPLPRKRRSLSYSMNHHPWIEVPIETKQKIYDLIKPLDNQQNP
jgi:hypothetical protein